jgi:hypothetical protein
MARGRSPDCNGDAIVREFHPASLFSATLMSDDGTLGPKNLKRSKATEVYHVSPGVVIDLTSLVAKGRAMVWNKDRNVISY